MPGEAIALTDEHNAARYPTLALASAARANAEAISPHLGFTYHRVRHDPPAYVVEAHKRDDQEERSIGFLAPPAPVLPGYSGGPVSPEWVGSGLAHHSAGEYVLPHSRPLFKQPASPAAPESITVRVMLDPRTFRAYPTGKPFTNP